MSNNSDNDDIDKFLNKNPKYFIVKNPSNLENNTFLFIHNIGLYYEAEAFFLTNFIT